jgi:hypothetical protein
MVVVVMVEMVAIFFVITSNSKVKNLSKMLHCVTFKISDLDTKLFDHKGN